MCLVYFQSVLYQLATVTPADILEEQVTPVNINVKHCRLQARFICTLDTQEILSMDQMMAWIHSIPL